MKKYQVIVRTLMAAVIMFGVETTASAQFGGLLKKAKSAVKDQVDNKAKMSKYEVKDAINQARKAICPVLTKALLTTTAAATMRAVALTVIWAAIRRSST